MGIRLWPKNFERKEHITAAERYLLRNAQRNFKEGHFAVGIDPLGMSTDRVKMGMYISPKQGLVTFSVYLGKIEELYADGYITYVKMVEDKIYERLLDAKALIVRDGEFKTLKFPYKHIIMFAEETVDTIRCSAEKREQLLPYVTMRFFMPLDRRKKARKLSELKIFSHIRKPYFQENWKLSELECRAIFERLAPEYTVVMNEKEDILVAENKIVISDEKMKITGMEKEYKTFFLDEYQVAQVNDMGKGHRVILANPGAGKSVLILSKAFKYASLFKESKVLLTCYNSNLADSYSFKKACADYGNNRNLYIMTLHKLVKRIYEECMDMHCESNIATQEEIENCIRFVKAGWVKIRFKAIFIDEVQIFEPAYLELCYLLLEKDEDATFLMAGDLNQSVRAQSRRGDAPWKKMGDVKLDFTGRVKYIEKNYRNSQQIGMYLNRMLQFMNKKMETLELINQKEFEYDSFQLGEKQSLALEIQTGISRWDIKQSVFEAVKEITAKYQLGYSEIAILFPYKEYRSLNYRFLYWLEQAFNEAGIPYSLITSSKGGKARQRYSQSTGIILSTIDASLGLDFRAVILAGLYPYNYVFTDSGKKHIGTWNHVVTMNGEEQEAVQVQMRKLYTACSRARDVLYVLSDLQQGSPMEEILTSGRK